MRSQYLQYNGNSTNLYLLAVLWLIFSHNVGGVSLRHTRCPASHPAQSVSNLSCCEWSHVLHDLQSHVFAGDKCGAAARSAIRLTFHDTIGLSKSLQSSGVFGGSGAGECCQVILNIPEGSTGSSDGSIITFSEKELADPANAGLQAIVDSLRIVADSHNVSYGDIIQFAGAVALTHCPGGPRLPFLAGRPPAVRPTPPNLTPAPFDSAEKILARMADAGFTAEDTVALLAAHSVATQETMVASAAGAPLDSTPRRFDSQFYMEILLKGRYYPGNSTVNGEAKSPLQSLFRLSSDVAIARDPRTACTWESFIYDQRAMKRAFVKAMIKVANNGQNVHDLIDCSDVIPYSTSDASIRRLVSFPAGTSAADLEVSCPNPQFSPLSSKN